MSGEKLKKQAKKYLFENRLVLEMFIFFTTPEEEIGIFKKNNVLCQNKVFIKLKKIRLRYEKKKRVLIRHCL